MVFQCINIRQVPWEVLKTAASGLGFQHLPRDLANVNAWKTMFDPYNDKTNDTYLQSKKKSSKDTALEQSVRRLLWTMECVCLNRAKCGG